MRDEEYVSMGMSGASHALYIKDVGTKAAVADLEAKAAPNVRARDVEAALNDIAVSKRIRNGTIAGLVVLGLIALSVFVLFYIF